MALRRLFSGWLIAMAALARSLAQALERASEDRSAPAPDPVMAALAERYPGAPAHWLAHVAERTSQLAETGEAPFSLNSDPTAWPSPLPDGRVSRPLEAAPPPRRAEPTPRRDAEVPSLAALRERPSEVWRRAGVEPRRRPRPVFAAAPERSTPSATPTVSTPAPGRPRSPLSIVQTSSQPVLEPPRATPAPEASAGRPVHREANGSDAPPLRSALPEKGRSEVREAMERPRGAPVFTHAALKSPALRSEEPPETDAAAPPPPAVRPRRAWFFAKPRSGRSGRPLDLSAIPSRGRGAAAEAAIAADAIAVNATTPRSDSPYATSERRAVGTDRIWRALTPSTARRAIFQVLASLRAKPRRPADRPRLPEPRSRRAPPLVQPPSEAARRPPAASAALAPAAPSTRAVSAFMSPRGEVPERVVEAREPSRPAERDQRRSAPLSAIVDEPGDEDRRPAFAAPRSVPPRSVPFRSAPPRSVSTRPASRRFVDTPPEGRWPALPPTTLTAPAGVEAAPPRWQALAREQEEGRWSV